MITPVLVEPAELQQWIDDDRCVVIDCRFDLKNPGAGRNAWLEGHIPGAAYAHLDDDLAGQVTGRTGRHPLPQADAFADFLGRSGWQAGKFTVAYDGGGGMIAARLWWLMHYFGLDQCGLLDGGLSAWMAASLPLESGKPDVDPTPAPSLTPDPTMVMRTEDIAAAVAAEEICLLDARSAERFRGETEPLDPVAGHIPGARNFPCEQTLTGGRLKTAGDLRAAFEVHASPDESTAVVHMCGSGVTACLNLFAMVRAGYVNHRLYAGSWSEWIRDPKRPVAMGEE